MTNETSGENAPHAGAGHQMQRRFGFLQATALNMSNMVGVGPFITIPLLMSAMGGPQALLGWFAAMLICLPDGLIWSELGAAMPGSGGTYVYLKEAFGPARWGRFMAFLFIWQFILSGPLEIASGFIGAADYLGYVFPGMTWLDKRLVGVCFGLVLLLLLYRQISSIAKITVGLWVGMIVTTGTVIAVGAWNFDAKVAFDFPPDAFKFSLGFLLGLGMATRIGIYDYLGYYDICYIGDEVKDPAKTIPKSIMVSLVAVALLYLGINLSIIGTVPWREFVPAADHAQSGYIVSVFMERTLGSKFATGFTLLVIWTALASLFALLLGYSRIPFAAARAGDFFPAFGKLHPTKHFPHLSLVALALISIACSFISLGTVIDALVTLRIVIQFIGQIAAVVLLRRCRKDIRMPYRMWLYPLPCFLALAGWLFVFATAGSQVILLSLGMFALGVMVFLSWSAMAKRWPFGNA